MTTTEIRPATHRPWPSRREREGGRREPISPPVTVLPVTALPVTALPVTALPVTALPVTALPVLDADRTVRLPVVAGPRSVAPGARPDRPARPAVGSGVRTGTGHRTDGRVRAPRNGAGLVALCLGPAAVLCALTPVTSLLAAGLGVLALTYGIVGWSRARARTATNRGCAVTGAAFGLVALLLGVLGTITFVQNPDRAVYDLDALSSAVHSIGE